MISFKGIPREGFPFNGNDKIIVKIITASLRFFRKLITQKLKFSLY